MKPSPPPNLPSAWLEPFPLPGGVFLPNRILPGPMEGVTTGSFCQVLSENHLVRCWITPFIRITTGVPRLSRLRARLRGFRDCGLPFIAQIMGLEIELLAGTAKRLVEAGAIGIDLNCGCPSKTVLRSGAGAARLRDPQWIHSALVALRQACPTVGISVKLRSGFQDPAEMEQILPAVLAAKPDFATVHFRTAMEGYARVEDALGRMARARELLAELPLFGSGDLFRVEDARRLWQEARVDGVLPARGLMRNPRLLRDLEAACAGEDIREPTRKERLELLAQIASGAGSATTAHPGFVLELAGWMFGKKDPFFAELSHTKDLAGTLEKLKRDC